MGISIDCIIGIYRSFITFSLYSFDLIALKERADKITTCIEMGRNSSEVVLFVAFHIKKASNT